MIKRFFSKIKMLWRRIPMQARVAFNVIVIAALLSIPIYILAFEIPLVNNMEGRFRWEEKRRMIGPSNIIAVADVNAYSYFREEPESDPVYDRLIIAETQKNVILCGYSTKNDEIKDFNYVSKQGKLTFVASTMHYFSNNNRCGLLVLIDDCPEAVRANVTINLRERESFEIVYTQELSASRELPGCFLFDTINLHDDMGMLDFFDGEGGYYKRYCSVLVELYDEEDQLIYYRQLKYDYNTVK